MEMERRTAPLETTLEYRDDGKTPVIVGYAAVFESESRNLGGFVETIRRGAFDRVLAARQDVVGVYNHDKNYLLGRTSNGTMTLSVDEHGLRYAITPPATRADVVESVQRGDVTGSSFAFAVEDGGDVWSRRADGTRHREIRQIGLLDDVGPVVRPAYDASSVVVARRCFEIALGENFRPSQTMANAAKRGLRLAERHDFADQKLIFVAERIASREIVTPDEVAHLSEVFARCEAARGASWSGTPAWIEWQLAGGDAGQRWTYRRIQPLETKDADAEARAAGEVNLRATSGMAAACKRGLRLYEAGRGGDGLVPETISWARKIAARENLTPEKVIKMRAWHARHAVDKRPGWDAPGKESAGFVAYLLWAGAAGRSFSERKAAELERMGMRSEGDKSQSTPAPEGDQIHGSDKNKPGSAKNASGRISVSPAVREALKNKVSNHNDEMEKASKPSWSRTTIGQLLSVYRRGAGAYSTSHRPNVSRAAWAMARVNAYLYLLRNGKPKDAKYVTDNDLLPSDHPKSSKEKRDMDGSEGEMDDYGDQDGLSEANSELAGSLQEIAGEYGQWPQGGPDGAHYLSDNPFAADGIRCSNCVFYEGEGLCHIVSGQIAPNAVCKLWIIPEDRMSDERSEAVIAEKEEPVVDAEKPAPKDESPDYTAQIAALKVAALQIHLHGNS